MRVVGSGTESETNIPLGVLLRGSTLEANRIRGRTERPPLPVPLPATDGVETVPCLFDLRQGLQDRGERGGRRRSESLLTRVESLP